MPDQTYSERVRHPSNAFNPSRDKSRPQAWWFWILVCLALLLYFGWCAGMFRKHPAILAPANPFGWM
jgi:hypothetical protein